MPNGRIVFSPLTVPIVFLLGWLPVALWAAPVSQVAWSMAGYLAFGIALYGACVHWPPVRRQPAWLAGGLLSIGGGLALIAPLIVRWKSEFRLFRIPLYERISALQLNIGETIHANILAAVLVLMLPLVLALLLAPLFSVHHSKRQWYFRGGLAILFVYTLALLVLTQSRGGLVGVAAAFAMVIWLRWPKLIRFFPVFLLAGGFLFWQFGPSVILDQVSQDDSFGGWPDRLAVWAASVTAIRDFAFTGIGIGMFPITLPLLYPIPFDVEGYPHAHHLFLQVALDLGLPGLIAFLALLINLWVMLIQLLRQPQLAPLPRALTVGATASLLSILIHGQLDAASWGTKLAFFPWLLYALITTLFLRYGPGGQPTAEETANSS